MIKTKPLWERLYDDKCYMMVVLAIRYEGCLYRELWDKLKDVVKEFGQQRTESATWHLLTFEGQMTVNPKPLANVQLRAEVRKLAWGLMGPPPEHPWYPLWKKPEPLPPPWEMEPDGSPKKKAEPPPATKPKRTRKKAS